MRINKLNTNILVAREKIILGGELSVYDAGNDELLFKAKNQITNNGAAMFAKGYGVRHISYLAVGRGISTKSIYDTILQSEITRYPITAYKISNGVAVLTINMDDNFSARIEEWGLYMDSPITGSSQMLVASGKNSGVLFSRETSALERKYKQKLMAEWRISLQ